VGPFGTVVVVPAAEGRRQGVALVLLAAGSGSRVGRDVNKVFLPLAGRRVLTWSLDTTTHLAGLVTTVVVVQDADRPHLQDLLRREAPGRQVEVVLGGATRHASESAALTALAPRIRSGEVRAVMIHDAARPLATPAMYDAVAAAADLHGGALPVIEKTDLIYADGAAVLDRLVTVQTPQAFSAGPLLAAFEAADSAGFVGSDTASCMEHFSDATVATVPGDPRNIKITFADDLFLAERLLSTTGWRVR